MYSGSYIKFALIYMYIKNSNISWYILGEKKTMSDSIPQIFEAQS